MINQKLAPTNTPPVIQAIVTDSFKKSISLVAPSGYKIDPERVIKLVKMAADKAPALYACSPKSFMYSVIAACQLGLEINGPLGECYLVPFGKDCTLVIGYRGIIGLMHRTGLIKSISAYCVYEKDAFEIEYGTTPRISHMPCITEEPGAVIGVYAVVTLPDGATQFDYMRIDEVLRIKERSRSGSSGPWVKDFNEMARKSVVKRLSKYIPMSEQSAAAIAIQADNLIESGETLPLDVDVDQVLAEDEEYAEYSESEDAK